jgi:hypothetical protein
LKRNSGNRESSISLEISVRKLVMVTIHTLRGNLLERVFFLSGPGTSAIASLP